MLNNKNPKIYLGFRIFYFVKSEGYNQLLNPVNLIKFAKR